MDTLLLSYAPNPAQRKHTLLHIQNNPAQTLAILQHKEQGSENRIKCIVEGVVNRVRARPLSIR